MIALTPWITPDETARKDARRSLDKNAMHHEPESLIVFAAILLIGLACHVAACWRKA